MVKVNNDMSIYATRGDSVTFTVTATEDGSAHQFQAGDVLRIKVFEKKACENVVLQKDFAVESASASVDITLTEKDTRIGGIISKPKVYWYEVELNPFDNPQTIIGYDDDGAKVFMLFPEGRDLEDGDIEEADIPIVDADLDMTSTRPIQNQAVARKFASMDAEAVGALSTEGGMLDGDLHIRRMPELSGYASVYKNHREEIDHGLHLRDTAEDGTTMRIVVSATKQRVAVRTNDGVEHDVFGAHNTDALNEAIRHHMKDYTDLSQIGLTIGEETIESIASRLPTYSRLTLTVGATNNASTYPNGNYGLLVVEKTVNSRIVFTFTNNQAKRWIGVYAISSNGNTWTDWVQ